MLSDYGGLLVSEVCSLSWMAKEFINAEGNVVQTARTKKTRHNETAIEMKSRSNRIRKRELSVSGWSR